MKRFIIVGIVAFIVLAYLVTYRVRFTETAVKTTFGEASAAPVDEPGLKFMVPYVQNVVKYDKRARYLESKPETVLTKDQRQVVITAYLTWKVTNPKLFYQVFSGNGERATNHYRGAERMLGDKLRGALGQVSQFRFDEILSTSEAGSKLGDCEAQILKYIVAGSGQDVKAALDAKANPDAKADAKTGDAAPAGDTLEDNYGVMPVSIGILAMELPEETTGKVFEAMQANRAYIANQAVSQGNAQAETIRSTAENDAKTILQFAESRAARIRAEGITEAQKYMEQLNTEPELAVFIRNMELMKESFGTNRVTIMMPAGPNGWPGLQLFQPSFMSELKSGKLAPFAPQPKLQGLAEQDAKVTPAAEKALPKGDDQ